jgi:rRNA-processing protein FCF1
MSQKYHLLELIKKAREGRWSEDQQSLKKEGIAEWTIVSAKTEGLIAWSGTEFYLTAKGNTTFLQMEMNTTLKSLAEKLDKPKQGVIFDSNIFDRLVDGSLTITEIENSRINGYEYYVTHIQTDEISACGDEEKRKILILFLTSIKPTVVGTESFILGKSRLGFAKLGNAEVMEKIKKENPKHTNDALIGETAIKNKFVLVSGDDRLRKKVVVNGGTAYTLEEFKEVIK